MSRSPWMWGVVTRVFFALACLALPARAWAADHAADVRPHGTYFVRPAPAQVAPFGPGPRHRIIYMNRAGGALHPGDENSATNTTGIVNQESTLSPFPYSDTTWHGVVDCMRAMYAPFDVEITETDPGNVDHIESMVAGSPSDVNLPDGYGGVAMMNGDCSVMERGIAFTFPTVWGNNVRDICETAAQETAHSLGLDHEFLCEDPMTYLSNCGNKAFRDIDADCGEYASRQCSCGGSKQNSVKLFLQILGPAPGGPAVDHQAPTITLTSPAEGAQVAPGFQVTADAQDNVGVTKVDLYVDGAMVASDGAAPYQLQTAGNLAAGTHTVEVRAHDVAGNSGTDSASVMVAGAAAPDGGSVDNPDDPSGGNATGGCGCSVGGEPSRGGAMICFLAAAVALFVALRRRHRKTT